MCPLLPDSPTNLEKHIKFYDSHTIFDSGNIRGGIKLKWGI